MKEYKELNQLFEQHGRPINYRAFSEHPDVQPLKIQLGPELTCIFLCLLSQRCSMNNELFENLLHYKNKHNLRDLETAILELVKLEFVINFTLIHTLCAKAGRDTSFLPSVHLCNIARQAGFLKVEDNQISPDILDSLETKKIIIYEKLIKKSALDAHVLKNISYWSSSKDFLELDACVDIYYYATLCQCTEHLNAPDFKIDVLDLISHALSIACTLKELQATHRLTTDTFLLACIVIENNEFLLPTLACLEQASIDITFFCRCIMDRKIFFLKISEFHKIMVILKRYELITIDNALIQTLIVLNEKLELILNSTYYLEQRLALTPACFTWIINFYEEQQLKEFAALASARERSTGPFNGFSYRKIGFSLSRFSYKNTEPKFPFEIAAVLFALSQTHLLHEENEWILHCLTPSRADFIQQLFQCGELNQHSLHLARETNFDERCLAYLILLAELHVAFPSTLPTTQGLDYLECLSLLAPLAASLPAPLQYFAFAHSVPLKQILKLLITQKRLALERLITMIEICQQTTDSTVYLKEQLMCILLQWPMTEVEPLATSTASSEVLFNTLHKLQEAGIIISPTSENNYILPGFYQTTDPVLEAEMIMALSAAHTLNREVWELVCSVDLKIKRTLSVIIQRLVQHGQCYPAALMFILSSNKSALALEVFLLLTTENLSASTYGATLMQHAHPLLLCRGLIELNMRGLLTHDYFLKITQAKQPLLAAKALSQLLLAGIPLASCWDDIAETQNPDECTEMAVSSATPGKLGEDLLLELRTAVIQHAQPKLARLHVRLLLPIPGITLAYILQILQREKASVIVQAILQLNELRPLSDAVLALIIHDPKMLAPLKDYFALESTSQELFTQLCQASSVKEAENLVKREHLMLQYPQIAVLLREGITDLSKLHEWTAALTLLKSMDEVNTVSIRYLQTATSPKKRAEIIIALKKSGLYTADYFERVIIKEKQTSSVYNALKYLAEEGELNATLFNFVMINSGDVPVKAALMLIKMPDIQPVHLDWLAAYHAKEYTHCVENIIITLRNMHLLNRSWIEKLMRQKEPSLEHIALQLVYIPSALLDEETLKKIFTHTGVYYVGDEKTLYNPFKILSEEDNSLLTKEVIDLVLMQSEGNFHTVYSNMVALKQAHLFRPEIVPCCITEEHTQAVIALSNEQLWNETNKAIVLTSRDPHAEAMLIISLAQQSKYSQATADLLLLRIQLNQTHLHAKTYAGNNTHYFSTVFKQLIIKHPTLHESTLQCLLSQEIKWKSVHALLDIVKDNAITDDSVRLIAVTDQAYLHAYLNYSDMAFEKEGASLLDILKLCEYEPLLNHTDLLNAIKAAASCEARKQPLETEKMQHLLSDLWLLCQAGDQAAITEHILSPTARVAATVCRTQP